MKKTIYLSFVLACLMSYSAISQETPVKKSTATTVTFASEKEKNMKIKELEAKIKINESDPTYPVDVLAKEKQELLDLKKAKVNVSNNSKN